jgi:hypothetical protein
VACGCFCHVSEDDVGQEAARLMVGVLVRPARHCLALICPVLHGIALQRVAALFSVFCRQGVASDWQGCDCGHGWNGIE